MSPRRDPFEFFKTLQGRPHKPFSWIFWGGKAGEDFYKEAVRALIPDVRAEDILWVHAENDVVTKAILDEVCAKLTLTADRPRVVVIPRLDQATTSGWNKLLKSVEQPPSDAFFLMGAPTLVSVPATLRSRSCLVRLPPQEAEPLPAALEERFLRAFLPPRDKAFALPFDEETLRFLEAKGRDGSLIFLARLEAILVAGHKGVFPSALAEAAFARFPFLLWSEKLKHAREFLAQAKEFHLDALASFASVVFILTSSKGT